MLNSTSLVINGQKYRAEIGQIIRDGINIGYNLDLYKTNVLAGSVNVFVSATLSSSWTKGFENSEENKNWLRDLLVITLPHINILCENDQIKTDDLLNFNIIFVSDRNQIDGNRIYVQSEWKVESQVEKLVYYGEVDDEKVEVNILDYLHKCWQQNPQPIDVQDLIKALYVDFKFVERALGVLEANKEVIINEYTGSIMNGKIIISTKGINKLREMKKEDTKLHGDIYHITVGGDFVQGSKNLNTTYGQGSHIIQNSNDIKIINENIDKLLQELESNYKGSDKKEIIQKVSNLRKMITNGFKVVEIVDRAIEILPKIKKYAAAALYLLHLLNMLYTTSVK